ncbi:MAG: hypothetical protein WHS82_01425 [Candidatus Methanosuratincola sp.]
MIDMKALVVYYSRTGTTRKVAEEIASLVGCDMEEIVDLKNRKGLFGFLGAGYSAFARKLTEIKAPERDPSAYDLVVVGTPIWAGNITPAVRTYLTKALAGGEPKNKYALFYTSFSSGEQAKAYADFCALIKGKPVASLSVSNKEVEASKFEAKAQGFVDALKSSETSG